MLKKELTIRYTMNDFWDIIYHKRYRFHNNKLEEVYMIKYVMRDDTKSKIKVL